MRKLIIIVIASCFLHDSFSQEQKNYKKEIGINLLTPMISALGGYTDFITFSVSYKYRKPKYFLRITLNAEKNPKNRETFGNPFYLFNSFIVSSTDTSEYRNENYYNEGWYYWLNFGVEKRKGNKTQFIYGVDFSVGLRKGQMLTYKTYYEDQTYNYSWGTIISQLEYKNLSLIEYSRARTYYIGLMPFVGIIIPISERISVSMQLAFDIYYNMHSYDYIDASYQTQNDTFQFFSTHTDRIINDISIFYSF